MSSRTRSPIALLLLQLLLAADGRALMLDSTLTTATAFVSTTASRDARPPAEPAASVMLEPAERLVPVLAQRPDAAPSAPDSERVAIADFLQSQLGEPYRFGAAGGREGFDCSGLVLRAYAAAGLAVPRVSHQQLAAGTAVASSALQVGDLLFYRMQRRAPSQLHVVVYIGDGRAIHASVTHRKVREIDVTRAVWSERFVAARRLL